ncbi:MAG TPA: hypothetical protein VKD65_11555 [Candidatus Angelobacter sp.]|nr:hypothetical protein [Candidatus Angelobacter sp.]
MANACAWMASQLIVNNMWWTAITLAAVAAWFEWTYRRSGKRSEKNLPVEPSSEKARKPVESKQAEG